MPLEKELNADKHNMCSQCETLVEKAAPDPEQGQMVLLSGHFGSPHSNMSKSGPSKIPLSPK